ncbi:hypothetical protein Pla110_11020 [Polystyrenella longa]|uniref:Zinc-finger domain-containing protein n=1 Tax=Polystyrenella longa TaxID=2528007 RepID=A0A518CJP6_9PLAN|nr:hypothetical protein [Polystyrenella longa]QDU79394.1 hypothetical protein Pla110_11020 [Polystyrenella longa]
MSADELISALFDGELTEQERAEVVKKLEKEPATQRERDEIAHISAALKGLPQAQAPDELRARIRQQIERESLLGSPAQPVAASTPAKTNSHRILYAAVGLATTTAAAIFLMVYLVGEREDAKFGHVASSIEIANKDMADDDRGVVLESEELFSSSPAEEVPLIARTENSDKAPGPNGAARFSVTNEVSGSNPAQMKKMQAKPVPQLGVDAPLAKGKGLDSDLNGNRLPPLNNWPATDTVVGLSHSGKFNKDLTQVPIGAVVKATHGQGDQVEVVHMTVVDRFQSFSDFQILLQRHEITNGEVIADTNTDEYRARESGSAEDKSPIKVDQKEQSLLAEGLQAAPMNQLAYSQLGDQNLVAVFVTAPPDKIEAALAEMQQVSSLAKVETAANVPSVTSLSCEQFAYNMDSMNVNNNGVAVDFRAVDEDIQSAETLMELAIINSGKSEQEEAGTPNEKPAAAKSPSLAKLRPAEFDNESETNVEAEPRVEIVSSELADRGDSRDGLSRPSLQRNYVVLGARLKKKTFQEKKTKRDEVSSGNELGVSEYGYQVALTFPRAQLSSLWDGVTNDLSGSGGGSSTDEELFGAEGFSRQGQTERQNSIPESDASFGNRDVSIPAEEDKAGEGQSDSVKNAPNKSLAIKSDRQEPAKGLNQASSDELKSNRNRLPQPSEVSGRPLPSRGLAQYLFIFETSPAKRTPAPAERPDGGKSSWFLAPIREEHIPS